MLTILFILNISENEQLINHATTMNTPNNEGTRKGIKRGKFYIVD